jgi:hypothetical protein
MNMFKSTAIIGTVLALTFGADCAQADDAKPLYENNFEKAEIGKVPEEMMVLDGGFEVKQEDGNKFLELPGAPLDTYSVLFGPTLKSDAAVSARIRGTTHGRRSPTFAVGLNGQGGYRLQVSPGKKALEIFKGDDSLASVPYEWKSGAWTTLKLQVTKTGAGWKVEGKAWTEGSKEPKQSMISYEETKEPPPGRASIWGSPFSTTPIQYDDLLVKAVEPAK